MALGTSWNSGGGALVQGAERPSLRDIVNPLTGLTLAQLKALPYNECFDGMRVTLTDGRSFRWMASSVLTTDGDQLLVIPTHGVGVFLLEVGSVVDLSFPITAAMADATVLYTMPTGAVLLVRRGYWGVTLNWTGGSSSTIGLSSGQSPHNTKGDLHGGAGGDGDATLVSAGGLFIEGTVGADVAAGIILKPTATILLDLITSNHTAGTGFAHIVGELLANAGA